MSSSVTTIDDILLENTFFIRTTPRRCLLISPFFWALVTLAIASIVLIMMGIFYNSSHGLKYYHRLKQVFRHSDLIGNGEMWFGGLISFSLIILIVYNFWFGTLFVVKYPMETSSDFSFACDTSLKNTLFSSSLQLLATSKSSEDAPIFDMLNNQKFTMTVTFIQTGYTCDDVTVEVKSTLIFIITTKRIITNSSLINIFPPTDSLKIIK